MCASNTISEKVIPETERLEMEISAKEKEMLMSYLKLGMQYYRLNKNLPAVELADLVSDIKKAESDIAQLKLKMNACDVVSKEPKTVPSPQKPTAISVPVSHTNTKPTKVSENSCTKCGGELFSGDLYCTWCGQRIEAKPEPAPLIIPRCAKCGNELEEGSIFCSNCGTKV